MPTSPVTVVVMTRDRLPDLLRTLPRHEAPVLVVDNGSTDGTVAELRRLRQEDPAWAHVDVLPLGRNAGAVARTQGARAVATPFVAFADDDSWWAPGALALAVRTFLEHPRLGLLTGRVLVGPDERQDPVDELLAAAPLGRAADLPGPDVLGFLACAAVVRRDAFRGVGGFDDVVFFRGEEERVALDLVAAGWGCAYVPEVVVHHHPSPRGRRADGSADVLTLRSWLLTALMRRSWAEVRLRVRRTLARGAGGRRALVATAPRVPRALLARRPVPAWLEQRARSLEQAHPAPAERMDA